MCSLEIDLRTVFNQDGYLDRRSHELDSVFMIDVLHQCNNIA
jgi:hypothetical protein